MKATEILSQEHRYIEQVIGSLEAMVAQARKTNDLDLNDARSILDFIRSFADRYHHAKEEDLLFTKMQDRGMLRELGPIAVMLHEHDLGRTHVGKMFDAICRLDQKDQAALASFSEAALGYASLLREHIYKEDHILYKMANQLMNEEDDAELLQAYGKLEQNSFDPGTQEKYRTVATQLGEKYGVPRQEFVPSANTGCFGCASR